MRREEREVPVAFYGDIIVRVVMVFKTRCRMRLWH
jgi:hypothetical protein